jgi:hypothetical protein
MHRLALVRPLALGLAMATAPLGCVDEYHDAQVQALGGEAPGVPRGPFHRPGQPCVLCHGTAGPASTIFSIAGTVFAVQGQKAPAAGATVNLEDVNGHPATITTNAAGNFYITASQWLPTFPIAVPSVTQGDKAQFMITHVARDGSCAACHTDPASTTSPGAIYMTTASVAASADGGP